ncbi:MAG: hypothetical protein KIT09_05375 [Bryobacteraceae bacterium]|nr:hypothetical protein [Bryobacteraceae bacterium]
MYTLPPLILHPFSDATGPGELVESSRASLIMHGLLPQTGQSREELERKLLAGRYSELKMLCYVGKDLVRWVEQCLDFAAHQPELGGKGIAFQSFACLLVYDPPANVMDKMRRWGVTDYKGIFSRAIGLHSVFTTPPPREILSDDFLRHYYRYADHLFAARLSLSKYAELDPADYEFPLYASGEYARMLEREWEGL